jgi:tRNA A-37 threonylcarbamoyl transferase component Bud32
MSALPSSSPATTVGLSELLLRWEDLRRQGGRPSAAEVCADQPELAPELEKQIQAILAMEAMLAVGKDTPTEPETPDGPQSVSPASRKGIDFFPSGYEVLEELGQGGMGVVYKARHQRLARLVAIKRLRAGVHAQPSQLARFRNEAEALARVQHPNIVQVFDVGEHDGEAFLALELVEGQGLAQKLARSVLPAREAAGLVETLARGIHSAHERGVIHRDLKPANVLFTTEGTAKISDFGLAKCLDNDAGPTRTGEIMGTPSYLAPEQAEGKSKEVGPAADIYALGAILYECLTGRPPFQGESTLDTLEQVRLRDPLPPSRLQPKVPRDLETICLKCLEKAPRQRYGSARELADDLARFQTGEPIRARRASLAERGLKWVKRRPTQAALVAVTCTAALVLLAVWAAFTAQVTAERNHAREQEGIARANQKVAETERDRAEQQRQRAEALLVGCTTAVRDYAQTTVRGKGEAMATGEQGAVLYVLACFYAKTAGAFPEDIGLTSSDRSKLAEEYASRAVYLLKQAMELGYFARPENRNKLRQDQELASLRSRRDFQDLVRSVGGGR